MAGKAASVAVRITVRDGEVTTATLRQLGEVGQKALEKIETAARDVPPALRAIDAGVSSLKGEVDALSARAGVLGEVMAATGPLGSSLAAAAGAFAIVGGAAATMTLRAIESASAIADSAAAARVSAEAYQALSAAASDIGVELSTLDAGMKRLAINQADVTTGQGALFTALGATNKALLDQFVAAQDNEQALTVVMRAIDGARSEQEALNLATLFFGDRAGPEMLRVIQAAEGDLGRLITVQKEAGRVTRDDLIATADAAGDRIAIAHDRMAKSAEQFGARFSGVAADVIEGFAGIIDWANRTVDRMGAAFQATQEVRSLAGQLAGPVIGPIISARARPEGVSIGAPDGFGRGSGSARGRTSPTVLSPPAPPTASRAARAPRAAASGRVAPQRPGAARDVPLVQVDLPGRRRRLDVEDIGIGQQRRIGDFGRTQYADELAAGPLRLDNLFDWASETLNAALASLEMDDRAKARLRDDFGRSFADGVIAASRGDFGDWARSFGDRLLVQMLESLGGGLFDRIGGSGRGGLGGILSSLGGLFGRRRGGSSEGFDLPFGGYRAAGGPVSPGLSYLVGERGMERFTPAVPGRIEPAGGLTVVVNNYTGTPVAVSRARDGDRLVMSLRQLVRDEAATGALARAEGRPVFAPEGG